MSQTPTSFTVDVNLSLQATGVTQAGFGTPMIMTDEGTYDDSLRVHTYNALSAVAEDWETATQAYKMASIIFAQDTTVETLKIGTCASYVAQVQTIVLSGDLVTSNVFTILVDGEEIEETFATDHLTTMTAIAAAIQATAGVSTAVVGGSGNLTITVTAQTSGVSVTLSEAAVTLGASQATVTTTVTTANHGPVDDLAEIRQEDDDFYFVLYTDTTKARVLDLVDAVQATKKMFITKSSASEIIDAADTDDLASYIKTSSSYRSKLFYSDDANQRADAGLVGMYAPYDPGEAHANLKTIASLSVSDLTDTQRNALENKQCFYYETHGGLSLTHEPARSDALYLDIVRDMDYAIARIEERILAFQISRPKIPFTDSGIALVVTQLKAELQSLVNDGVLASFDEPTFPLAASVSSTNKANRYLPDINFSATLGNAIYKITINGTLTL